MSGALSYVNKDRFNVDLGEIIEKRKVQSIFSKYYDDLNINEELKKELRIKFSSVSDVDTKRAWKRFKELQTFMRNEAVPFYQREYVDKYVSGVNTDEEVLKLLFKKTTEDSINYNAKRVFRYSFCLFDILNVINKLQF